MLKYLQAPYWVATTAAAAAVAAAAAFCGTELTVLMAETIEPAAAAAPMFSRLAAVTKGGRGEVTTVEPPGVNEPRIRVTSEPISSVIRLIRSRIVLRNAAPGTAEPADAGAF